MGHDLYRREETLPAGRPLLVAAARVVPAGLALVAVGTLTSRWRPRGAEWARTAVLALFNFGLFFPLLVVAVYRLPGGVAAAVGGLQPLLVVALSRLVNRSQSRMPSGARSSHCFSTECCGERSSGRATTWVYIQLRPAVR